MNLLTNIFWWETIPMQAVLLYLLLRNTSIKNYPFFFAYTGFSIFTGIGRFALRNTSHPYLYFYWASDAVLVLLAIAILHEVFKTVFGNLRHKLWFRMIFPIVLTGTLALTIVHAESLFTGKLSLFAVILASELAMRFLQVALFVLLICLVALFGLRWRQQAFGISAGFGIHASVCLLASTKLYEVGANFEGWWGVATLAAYTVAVVIWLCYFTGAPEPVKLRSELPPLSIGDLAMYRDAMQKVQKVRHI